MRPILAAALLIALPLAAPAAEKQALSAMDLVMMERVSDPRLAPDGRNVAYVLRTTDYAGNRGVKNLWLADVRGATPPRQLTTAGGNSESPRWSPDGKWLYFLSTRSGTAQVWRLYGQGGEAEQVTALPLDVRTFAIGPGGRQLAVSMDVFPDCKDLGCTRKRLDEQGSHKASGLVHDKLFVRHWDEWHAGLRSQLFVLALDEEGAVFGDPVLVSRGIDGDVPSRPFGDDAEYAFSPDGKSIVFAARIAGTGEAWSTNLDLFQAPVDGSGKPVNLTEGNKGTDTRPAFSPDGSQLAWLSMKRAGFEADRHRILVRNQQTGAVREVAAEWDRSAGSLAFSSDGGTLFTSADDLGQHRLFSIDLASGEVSKGTGAGWVSGFSVRDTAIVYALDSLTAPADLYLLDPAGESRRITHHNAARLEELQLGEVEQFTFKGAGGDTVHGHAMKPWNWRKGRKFPVAFIIHGGPQGSMGNHWHYRWNPAVFSGMGYGVVFIDFHGSTGYGQAFTDAISGDWAGKPLEDLQLGLAHALAKYEWLDATKVAALGASYGGFMVNWIAGNWSAPFKALVSHDGIFDQRSMYYGTEELWFPEWEHGGPQFERPEAYEKFNPVNHVSKWKLPMLVIHGEKDFRVPPEQGLAAFTALQRRGIPGQLLWFPDENHWVLKPQNSVQWHDTVQAWLKRWLG